jgi:hypothetical protein
VGPSWRKCEEEVKLAHRFGRRKTRVHPSVASIFSMTWEAQSSAEREEEEEE